LVNGAHVQLQINTPRLIQWLLLVTLLLVVFGWIASPFVNVFGLPHPETTWQRFNLDGESNFMTWFKSVLMLLSAMVTALLAMGRRGFVWHWWALCAVFALVSMDEVVGIHETSTDLLRNALHVGGLLYYAWIVPAFAFVLVFTLAMLRFFRQLKPPLRRGLLLGVGLYLLGALGMESLGGYAINAGSSPLLVYALVTCEEGLQMTGSVLVLCALLEFANRVVLARFVD
jgi:hypothetical protein